MDNKELRRQRVLAKAHFDSVLQMYEHGLATKDDLEAKRKIWQDLRDYSQSSVLTATTGGDLRRNTTIDLSVAVSTTNLRGMNPEAVIYDSSFDEAGELEAIQAELNDIDMRKNKKINELAKMPRDSNQLSLVTEIKGLREEYVNKSDEVYYFKRHGERFSAPLELTNETMNSELVSFDDSEFVKSLPRDKFELHRLKKNQETYLVKYNGRLKAAKTEVKKAAQRKNISIATIKINTIDQLMSTL